MASKAKLKTTTTITAIISLISFLYKMGLGILTMSMVLIVASLSTLLVFICKVAFVKNVTQTREKKKKAYLIITIASILFTLLFIAFVVLKIFGIDTSNKKTYEGLLGGILIGFSVLMLILSCFGLRGALKKDDLMVIGLKEITFISALTDIVIITEFTSRIILRYIDFEYMGLITSYVPLGVGVLMLITNIFMLVRYFKYKA